VIRVGDEFVNAVERAGQYAVLVDGEPVAILTLAPGVFEKIQIRTGFRWSRIIMDPLERIDVVADLVRAAHEKAGKEVPPLDGGGDIARFIVEMPVDLPDPVDSEGSENPTTASSTAG
jgi:hypothetical protein